MLMVVAPGSSLAKVFGWYDNEWGYADRLADLAAIVGERLIVRLAATRHGIAASFLYQPIELRDIEQPARDRWPWPECPQIIVRFGYGPKGADSPRRQLAAMIDEPAEAADDIRRR